MYVVALLLMSKIYIGEFVLDMKTFYSKFVQSWQLEPRSLLLSG